MGEALGELVYIYSYEAWGHHLPFQGNLNSLYCYFSFFLAGKAFVIIWIFVYIFIYIFWLLEKKLCYIFSMLYFQLIICSYYYFEKILI